MFSRQAACYREERGEFGEYLTLINLAMVSLDQGEVDAAIDVLERAIAGLQRIRAPYGVGRPRSLLALARALRGDDDQAIVHAREAYLAQVNNGPAGCDNPLMAAAMFHARRGDLPRAALIAGCVAGPAVRGDRHLCPMDARLDADVAALVSAGMPTRERDRCREAGMPLTLAQVAAIAFDDAPIDGGLRPGVAAAG
jgi:hypothetical protein